MRLVDGTRPATTKSAMVRLALEEFLSTKGLRKMPFLERCDLIKSDVPPAEK